ncbi:MAG: hypothetical protein WAX89_00970 [Alphaproteobacteria bacterium]
MKIYTSTLVTLSALIHHTSQPDVRAQENLLGSLTEWLGNLSPTICDPQLASYAQAVKKQLLGQLYVTNSDVEKQPTGWLTRTEITIALPLAVQEPTQGISPHSLYNLGVFQPKVRQLAYELGLYTSNPFGVCYSVVCPEPPAAASSAA